MAEKLAFPPFFDARSHAEGQCLEKVFLRYSEFPSLTSPMLAICRSTSATTYLPSIISVLIVCVCVHVYAGPFTEGDTCEFFLGATASVGPQSALVKPIHLGDFGNLGTLLGLGGGGRTVQQNNTSRQKIPFLHSDHPNRPPAP